MSLVSAACESVPCRGIQSAKGTVEGSKLQHGSVSRVSRCHDGKRMGDKASADFKSNKALKDVHLCTPVPSISSELCATTLQRRRALAAVPALHMPRDPAILQDCIARHRIRMAVES